MHIYTETQKRDSDLKIIIKYRKTQRTAWSRLISYSGVVFIDRGNRRRKRLLPCLCYKCAMAVLFPHLAVLAVCLSVSVCVCAKQRGLFRFHLCAGLHLNADIEIACLNKFSLFCLIFSFHFVRTFCWSL